MARKKPNFNKVNRAKCRECAQIYCEKPLGFWNNVIWLDEIKSNLFGSDGKIVVWRTKKEELHPKYTVTTTKHDDGNVKCWEYFSLSAIGNLVFIDGNMTAELDRVILQKN